MLCVHLVDILWGLGSYHHRAKLFIRSLCTPLVEGMSLAVSMFGAGMAHVTT